MRLRNSLYVIVILLFFTATAGADPGKPTILLPTPCHKVVAAKDGRIDVQSPNLQCGQVQTQVVIAVSPDVDTVDIYLDGVFWQRQQVTRFDTATLSKAIERGKSMTGNVTIPVNPHAEKAWQMAKQTADLYHSPEYQAKVQGEISRLMHGQFREQEQLRAELTAKERGAERSDAPILGPGDRVYIFISSSVPEQTLRRYLADADSLGSRNVILVMRGFIGGMAKIQPTIAYIAKLQRKDPSCNLMKEKCEMYSAGVSVDPFLFKRYGINQVPAFVYAQNVRVQDAEQSEGTDENAAVGQYSVVTGDVSLAAAMEEIGKELGAPVPEKIAAYLRGGFYSDEQLMRQSQSRR